MSYYNDYDSEFLFEEEDNGFDRTDLDEEDTLDEDWLSEKDDEDDMDAGEEQALENLAESLALTEATKIIRLTKESQIANLAGRSALILARRNRDPLFEKYKKFNTIRLQIKAQISKKYASKALQYGRKLYAQAQNRPAVVKAKAKK